MSKSIKCANSATDMITKSPYYLQSLTTILSLIPASTSFGTVGGGADRVSVKNRSKYSDCAFCSVAELVDLPECAIDLAFNKVKKKTGVFLPILHDPCHYLANVPTQPQT